MPLIDELDFEELALNMESLCAKQTRTDFVAQSKLIASYWKTSTFHGFGQMCPSELLCLNDAQTRRPMAQVSAAHAASTCLGSSRSLHLSLRSTARSFQQVTWRPVKH